MRVQIKKVMCFYVIWLRHSPARFQGFAPVLSSTTTTTTALGPLDWSLNSVVFSILSSFLLCLFLFRSLVHVASLNSAKISFYFEKWSPAFVFCFIAINCAREEKAIKVDHHKANPLYIKSISLGQVLMMETMKVLAAVIKNLQLRVGIEKEREREWERRIRQWSCVVAVVAFCTRWEWGSVSTV